jgi:hypothetical protein
MDCVPQIPNERGSTEILIPESLIVKPVSRETLAGMQIDRRDEAREKTELPMAESFEPGSNPK